MEHFNDLGRLGIGSRMKKTAMLLIGEVNAIYKQNGIDFEASLFPLLTSIEQRGPLNIREAEKILGTSHAYISQSAAALKKKGLIQIKSDVKDQRSKVMTLTQKSCALIQKARPIWQAMDRALADILFPDEEMFFQSLRSFEARLQKTPLSSLTQLHLDKNHQEGIDIVEYEPLYKKDFERLNREWLQKMFKVEAVDQEMFDHPEEKIIKTGGIILFARVDNEIVGTCALAKNGESAELCKMDVDPRYRGRGIGKKLIDAILKEARNKKISTVYLLSHSKLKSALHLYQACGFKIVQVKPADVEKYARADVRMEIAL